ncbi:response regulator [Conexibacter sp. W3-3-2]|uniref:LytR/AlgR family response regulator transcription factor n=1 Tax=Conexibacter sp. W3-3-2 TaxID=2675227 RepID=UPI0013281F53|nr:LytTR family DNA-binding domain-containing protein [Conexibacter sp. W3-3-2]MTD44949.1 response regulator [Conexibacter sp. W3-3-2]
MTAAPLTVLAVDDERPALEDLARMLRASDRVGEVVTAAGAKDALLELAQRRFDAVFLDVRMPGLDGVELARVAGRFAHPPALVFVTAYESAAVDAFALHALDYLMKPASRARIDEAVARVQAHVAEASAPPAGGERPGDPDEVPWDDGGDVVPVDNVRGGGTRLLQRSSILYLQAHGDYVRIVSDDGRFLLRARLHDIERRWTPHGFARVHRAYLVNLRRAVELQPQLNGTAVLRLADGSEVPISRRQVGDLRRRLQVR